MPAYEYKDWLVAAHNALQGARPDVRPEDLDPNAAFEAFRAGTSPRDFARQPVVPLRARRAAPTAAPPSPSARPTPTAPRATGPTLSPALAAVAVAAVVAVAIIAASSRSPAQAQAERAVGDLLRTAQDRGLEAAAASEPQADWVLQDLTGKDHTPVERIDGWKIVDVSVHKADDSETTMTEWPGEVARVRVDLRAGMEDGQTVRGTLTVLYVPLMKEVRSVTFAED